MRRDSRASSPWMKDEAISTISRIEAWKEDEGCGGDEGVNEGVNEGPKA